MDAQEIPLYNGKLIDYSLKPYVLKRSAAQYIEASLTKVLKQVEIFTEKALKNKALLKSLGIKGVVDATPTPLGLHIPFARFDFVFDSVTQDIFCMELNTDGTSGWNVVEWLGDRSGIPQDQNPNFRLSQRLLEGLIAHGDGQVVILDFKDVMTSDEQEDLARRWSYWTSVIRKSPVDKDWKDFAGALVYRRAVSWQLDKEKMKCSGFLNLWKKNHFTVVGGRSSDVGMSKAWPAILKTPFFAETLLLDSKTQKKILNDKDGWIIKPKFSHTGRGLLRGVDCSQRKWESTLKGAKDSVVQRRIHLPHENGDRVELGLFFINGKPAGFLCRSGHAGAITDTSKDVMRPVQIVD